MDTIVFIASKGRLDIYEDAADTDRILKEIEDGGGTLSEFEFFEKHQPVYYGVKDSAGKYAPLKFPEPALYGMGAPELYNKAVTYRDSWQRFIESIIKKKPSMMADVKKIMVLAFPIVIICFLIFIMVVVMGS